MNKKVFFYLYLLILVFLALPVIKVGPARVEQLLVLLTFGIVFLDDLANKTIDFDILFYMIGGALLLVLLSLNSTYPKIGADKYYIKYLFIYPVVFYVGSRIVQKLDLNNFINILDLSLLFYVVSWFIVMYKLLPFSIISKFIHMRHFGWGSEFLPIQGTFYEAGALGIIVGSIFLFSFMSRVEFNIWPKQKYFSYSLYILTIFIMVMSKNKTIWLSYALILIFLSFFKGYIKITRSSYYTSPTKLEKDKLLKTFKNINSIYLIAGTILLIIFFFLYNQLSSSPFITMKEFLFKLHHERGAQYVEAWKMIKNSNFFGGYGFGSVGAHFEGLHILGVDKDAGEINSVLLDLWVQGSILAVIYMSGIIYMGFNKYHLVTIVVPMYFVFFGLTNPIIAEEFFLLLGMSYSVAHMEDFNAS